MASLYGPAYGAGKIFEGATSGILKGNLLNDQRQQQEKQNLRQDQSLQMQQQQLGQNQQTRLDASQAAEVKRRADVFTKAFDIGSKAPPGSRSSVYTAAYKAFDQQNEPPEVKFDETGKDATLTLGDGTKVTGPVERIQQVSQTIAQAPERAAETIKVATQSGVIRFESMAKEKDQKDNLVAVEGYDEKGNKKTFYVPKQEGAVNLPGGFSETKPGEGQKPTDQINALKYDAYKAYLSGSATPQQQQIIGADKDPLIIEAARLVNNDIRLASKPIDEKVSEMMRIVDLLKRRTPQGGVVPGGQQNTRVRVKSPDGKDVGSIPANQLQDAISQGYTQVQ